MLDRRGTDRTRSRCAALAPPLHVRAVDGRQSGARSVRRPDPRAARSCRLGAQAGRARRLGRQPARRRPDPVGRPGRRARPDRGALQGRARRERDGRRDGDDEPVRASGLQGRRVHLQRPGRAPRGDRQGDALHRHRGRAGRRGLRLLGRARGHRGGRGEGPARRARALPRGDRRALGLRDRAAATTCASRWSPSPTSRAGTSSCPRSGTRCTSSRCSSTPRWWASTPRSRTRRWPGCRSTTRSGTRCGRASSSTSI